MAQENFTSHVVGSLYTLSEGAGHEIVSLFKEKSKPNASCHFEDNNHFIIHAPHNDDESLTYLMNCMREFIFVEVNKERDWLEDEMVIRLSGTHPSLTLAASMEEKMQAIKANSVALIEHENIIRRWSSSIESRELGLKLSLQLLGRIGTLCGCRIERADDSADLLIKADTEQDIEKAISKLERLNKMEVDDMSFPRIHSFYILEGETIISLQLVALKDLGDKRLVTTLLQKDSLIKSLQGLCVLVLVKGSNIVQVRLRGAASNPRGQLWNDHVYDCSQAQVAAKTPKEPENRTDKWVAEVPVPDLQLNAFSPETEVEMQQSKAVDVVHKEPSSPTKKSTKRARIARGTPNAFNTSVVESQNGYDIEKATTLSGRQSTGNVSAGKESESYRQPPSIEPPYMPSLVMPARSLLKTPSVASQQCPPSSSTWNVVARGSKSGSLIDMSVPNDGNAQSNKSKNEAMAVIDNLQDTTKAKARDLKSTMNQRKAPKKAFVGGDTALVKSFEETIVHLLALALPRTGRIGLTVDVGRLLINQQCGSSEFRNKNFKISEFSSVLPKGRSTGFETIFTNMLTARSSEAESILNVSLSQGRRLFQQEPAFKKIKYVFGCKAKGADQVIIKLDENGDYSMQGSEVLMGALDWHFPKRAWDARLRLTSDRFLATDYQRQAKGIVDSVTIDLPEDGQLLKLWTKTIDENFSIESITLRRETLHPVTIYPDLMLHLVECQDLHVRQPSNSESIYSGSIENPKVMDKANRLWWEANISSTSANSILSENLTLELGETATWSPSSIINKGVVRDLFAVAKEIVTQIDHVGFHNISKGSSGSKTAEKLSEKTRDAPATLGRVDPASFW